MGRALRLTGSVMRVFGLWGLLGGLALGGAFPLVLLPVMIVVSLLGQEAEFSTLFLIAAVGAMTGAIVGLAIGLVAGLLSSVGTLLFFRRRTGTRGHERLIRGVTVATAGVLTFFGVFAITGSTDMSAPSILIWRLPAALVAVAYGWWLAGRLLRDGFLWQWDRGEDAPPLDMMRPWEYERH